MKYTYLIFGICLTFLFTTCKPDFDLNAPYKDVTVVYGVLNHQDPIHYIKIYKGYQSHKQGTVFIDAKNPDSIYYYNQISVVLEEYKNDKPTSRKIPLYMTHDFLRDSGLFYYDKEKIIYYTTDSLFKDCSYQLVIKHNTTGKITKGITPMLGNGIDGIDFKIQLYSFGSMLGKSGSLSFYPAQYAMDYEFHVNFLFFEVDKISKKTSTHKVEKNISPSIGEKWEATTSGYFLKEFYKTFYEDIATHVKPNANVIRYMGTPEKPGSCIEIEGWAAGESMINYLLSNKPTSSFAQVNSIYSNMTSSDGLAFGFLSSRVKCPSRTYSTTQDSEDSLVMGSKTSHLGFRYWIEYNP